MNRVDALIAGDILRSMSTKIAGMKSKLAMRPGGGIHDHAWAGQGRRKRALWERHFQQDGMIWRDLWREMRLLEP